MSWRFLLDHFPGSFSWIIFIFLDHFPGSFSWIIFIFLDLFPFHSIFPGSFSWNRFALHVICDSKPKYWDSLIVFQHTSLLLSKHNFLFNIMKCLWCRICLLKISVFSFSIHSCFFWNIFCAVFEWFGWRGFNLCEMHNCKKWSRKDCRSLCFCVFGAHLLIAKSKYIPNEMHGQKKSNGEKTYGENVCVCVVFTDSTLASDP